MNLDSPVTFLKEKLGSVLHEDVLTKYNAWFEEEGRAISANVDRAGTPWVRQFDTRGKRVDEILYPREYWTMLRKAYEAGIVWRLFEEGSLIPHYLLGYVTSYNNRAIALDRLNKSGETWPD